MLLHQEVLSEMPTVASWLQHAEATRRIMREKYGNLTADALLTATVEENVLVQLENIRTHPAVAAALAQRRITLHGWVYKITTGEVFEFDPRSEQFVALSKLPKSAVLVDTPREVAVSI